MSVLVLRASRMSVRATCYCYGLEIAPKCYGSQVTGSEEGHVPVPAAAVVVLPRGGLVASVPAKKSMGIRGLRVKG